MPRFAANLTMLFTEVGFVDRFAAAANAGFTGVEYLFPYEYDRRLLQHALKEHRLTQVLHNLPAGRRARHLLPAGTQGRVRGEGRTRDRLRDHARMEAAEVPRGHHTRRRRP